MSRTVEHAAITEAYAELCNWLRTLGEPQGDDAADEIERLRSLLEDLVRAVEPFAKAIETEEALDIPPLKLITIACGEFRDYSLTIDNFRALLEAYLKAKGENNAG